MCVTAIIAGLTHADEAFALHSFELVVQDPWRFRIQASGATEIGVQQRCEVEAIWHQADFYRTGAVGGYDALPTGGRHCIFVRYVHDVRAHGGQTPPKGSVKVSLAPLVSWNTFTIQHDRILTPHHGLSDFVSVPVFNDVPDWICASFEGDLQLVRLAFC